MRLASVLVLLGAVLAGCAGPPEDAFLVEGLELPVKLDVTLGEPSGLLVYRLSSPSNLSMLLSVADAGPPGPGPLHVLLLTQSGVTLAYARNEYAEPASPEQPSGFVQLVHDGAREGSLLVLWAAQPRPVELTIRMRAEAQAVLQHEGPAQTWSWSDFATTCCASQPIAGAARGAQVPLGEAGTSTVAVVKVGNSVLSHGNVTIEDDEGARALRIEPAVPAPMRHLLTATGRTTLTVDAVGDERLRLHVTAASLPMGVLPERIWNTWAEPS